MLRDERKSRPGRHADMTETVVPWVVVVWSLVATGMGGYACGYVALLAEAWAPVWVSALALAWLLAGLGIAVWGRFDIIMEPTTRDGARGD